MAIFSEDSAIECQQHQRIQFISVVWCAQSWQSRALWIYYIIQCVVQYRVAQCILLLYSRGGNAQLWQSRALQIYYIVLCSIVWLVYRRIVWHSVYYNCTAEVVTQQQIVSKPFNNKINQDVKWESPFKLVKRKLYQELAFCSPLQRCCIPTSIRTFTTTTKKNNKTHFH